MEQLCNMRGQKISVYSLVILLVGVYFLLMCFWGFDSSYRVETGTSIGTFSELYGSNYITYVRLRCDICKCVHLCVLARRPGVQRRTAGIFFLYHTPYFPLWQSVSLGPYCGARSLGRKFHTFWNLPSYGSNTGVTRTHGHTTAQLILLYWL